MNNAAAWQAHYESVPNGQRIRLLSGETPLSFSEYFDRLENDDSFSDWYSTLLAGEQYDACFWEHPPLTNSTIDNDAEFVLIDAPTLARRAADPSAFRSKFDEHRDQDVITFPNLGGDALMVVPCPDRSIDGFPHLAAFLGNASATQIRDLWRATASSVLGRIGKAPLWLSTSGLGVTWLHIRLDSYPKYYQHAPYKKT